MNSLRAGLALTALLTLMTAASVHAEGAFKTGFIDKVFKDGDKEIKYVVFVPKNIDPAKPSPIILFLHGAGESGTDGEKQVKQGIGNAIKKRPDFPFITVLPQSQKGGWGADSAEGKRAIAILEEVIKTYKADEKRVYLTGLSMGGFGTWSMAAKYPDKWAAIVPICGGGDPKNADKIKDIPCWCFHGDDDKAVNVQKSRDMIDAIKKAGGKPEYTEYPKVGHNSWDKAYGTDELYTWMLKQKLK